MQGGEALREGWARMRDAAQLMDAMIGRWKTEAARTKPERRRKREPENPEFQF